MIRKKIKEKKRSRYEKITTYKVISRSELVVNNLTTLITVLYLVDRGLTAKVIYAVTM